jgi:diaminopimelate decarboxylase
MRGVDALPVFPMTAKARPDGHLEVGGVDVVGLAQVHGTPLYVFDETTVRSVARDFRRAFESRYPDVRVVYACKAFANVGLVKLLSEEGLGFDVVSGGEVAVVEAAGIPREGVYFHGNNKTPAELEHAVKAGIGRIVVDNLHELDVLEQVLERLGKTQEVLFRVSPGVDPHTHSHTTTGILDSKFGLPIVTGHAEKALAAAMKSTRIVPVGIHFHLGSPIFELEPYKQAIDITLEFAARMKAVHGFQMREFSPGGGFAVRYLISDEAPTPDAYAQVICAALKDGCAKHGLDLPKLSIEPGRAIVGRAGVAVYTVGATKEVPGIRAYVAVDGGMGDNIRPAIYGARYEAALASRMQEPATTTVTIAGKYCESGDILVKDCALPAPKAGDLVAIPVSGAYCLAMSSNYNASPRPEVLLVGNGHTRTIRRRETYQDLLAADMV